LTDGISIRNEMDVAIRFYVDAPAGRIDLPGVYRPGATGLVISGSAIGPDSRVVEENCTVGPMVAVDETGREAARHAERLCVGDTWVVAEP
jgi:hypothetical protein